MLLRFHLVLSISMLLFYSNAGAAGMCGALYLEHSDGSVRAATSREIVSHHKRLCATTCERSQEIYDACILAGMPRGTVEREVKSAIKSTCRRKACKPSFLDNLRF